MKTQMIPLLGLIVATSILTQNALADEKILIKPIALAQESIIATTVLVHSLPNDIEQAATLIDPSTLNQTDTHHAQTLAIPTLLDTQRPQTNRVRQERTTATAQRLLTIERNQ